MTTEEDNRADGRFPVETAKGPSEAGVFGQLAACNPETVGWLFSVEKAPAQRARLESGAPGRVGVIGPKLGREATCPDRLTFLVHSFERAEAAAIVAVAEDELVVAGAVDLPRIELEVVAEERGAALPERERARIDSAKPGPFTICVLTSHRGSV